MDSSRLLRRKMSWLAVLLAVAGLAVGTDFPSVEKALPSGTWHLMAEKAMRSDIVLFLLPLVSVLPFGDISLRERESRFLRVYIARKGKAEYVADRVVIGALSGGFAWTVATVGILFTYFLIFFPMEQRGTVSLGDFTGLLGIWARMCLIAGILANCSMAAGMAFGSVYMAYGLPFVGHYLLVILHERYLERIYVIDPGIWLSASEKWGIGQAGLWIFLILLLFLTAALHGGILYESCSEL